MLHKCYIFASVRFDRVTRSLTSKIVYGPDLLPLLCTHNLLILSLIFELWAIDDFNQTREENNLYFLYNLIRPSLGDKLLPLNRAADLYWLLRPAVTTFTVDYYRPDYMAGETSKSRKVNGCSSTIDFLVDNSSPIMPRLVKTIQNMQI